MVDSAAHWETTRGSSAPRGTAEMGANVAKKGNR